MQSIVLIQARTNSSRLPAKVLLPIRGMPVIVLAALRAGNKGRKVIVVTSNEYTDNALSGVLASNGLYFYRGSLNNTLERFICALDKYSDETLVFRLTADNILPDGKLLDEIEEDFLRRNIEYISCNGEPSGLPYGVSVELTRLKYMRKAWIENLTEYDQEHVTPYIIRKFGIHYFKKYSYKEMGNLRSTIDCLDDYLMMTDLFQNVEDPINEPFLKLVDNLKIRQKNIVSKKKASKIVLGTAQLGMNYGIANTKGQPTLAQATTLIKTAIANGIEYIDTARSYGYSEKIIGSALSNGWQGRAKVVSKLSPFEKKIWKNDEAATAAYVDASIYKTLNELGMQKIDVLLLHRAEHMTASSGQIWKRMLNHLDQGRINTLGVSVQSPSELINILDCNEVKHIQFPYNILDWRWEKAIEKLVEEKSKRALTIHVRSIYLQGLLLSRNNLHWSMGRVADPCIYIDWMSDMKKLLERKSIADLCLSYINALEWVDGIIIGVDSLEQLNDNMSLINESPISKTEITEIVKTRPKMNEDSLNPAKWLN